MSGWMWGLLALSISSGWGWRPTMPGCCIVHVAQVKDSSGKLSVMHRQTSNYIALVSGLASFVCHDDERSADHPLFPSLHSMSIMTPHTWIRTIPQDERKSTLSILHSFILNPDRLAQIDTCHLSPFISNYPTLPFLLQHFIKLPLFFAPRIFPSPH